MLRSRDVPLFTNEGLLPVGDYELTLVALRKSGLVHRVNDAQQYPHWDSAWREKLVDNLSVLVGQLMQVGVTEIFVDGSFVEDKDHPNDIDGYFECELRRLASGELQRELNLLDPYKIWTWDSASRRPSPGFAKRQLPMWHRYRVELYPHYGQPCGICDAYGNELEFPSAFRLSRRGRQPRGVVKIGVER